MLTNDEIKAVEKAGELYTFIVKNIIGNGDTREEDCRELTWQIHAIQHMIMAQSAARQHPEYFRLLGSKNG